MDARHWPKVVLGIAAVSAVVWLFASGQHERVDVQFVRDALRGAGATGMGLFVLSFMVVQPLGISGHLWVLAAALVWPPLVAIGLSLAGAVLGQAAAFLFYRYVAQEWAQKRVPARLSRFEERLSTQPFRSAVAIRLLSFTWPIVPLMLGVSRMPFWPMLAGTVLGLTPTIVLDVWLCQWLLERFFSP